jgi:hypothetical protein
VLDEALRFTFTEVLPLLSVVVCWYEPLVGTVTDLPLTVIVVDELEELEVTDVLLVIPFETEGEDVDLVLS